MSTLTRLLARARARQLAARPSLEHLELSSSGVRGLAPAIFLLGRDPHAIATGLRPVDLVDDQAVDFLSPVSSSLSEVRSSPREIEDLRLFNPDKFAPLRGPRRWKPRFIAAKASRATGSRASRAFVSAGVQFHVPSSVALCIRRKTRRQVILAKGHGGGGHRRPRRRAYSNIWC